MTVSGGKAFTPAWPLREASPGQLFPRLTEFPPLLPACSDVPGTAFSMWGFSLQIHFFWGFVWEGKFVPAFLRLVRGA